MFAKKSLGQHFLKCRWVVSTLIHAAELKPSDIVLEVGPGTGVLTRALAAQVKRVIAVEKDERLAEGLKSRLAQEEIENVEVVPEDILKKFLPLSTALGLKDAGYKLVSNIPYYLTSRLLRLLLETGPRPELIVLTIQKEVAQRITARPSKMNLLALSVQVYGKPEIIKEVPSSCFYPKPRVDSAIIKISDISDTIFKNWGVNPSVFYGILRLAFSKKRKMLLNSLGKPLGRETVEEALKKIKIPRTARPEELSLKNWCALVSLLA